MSSEGSNASTKPNANADADRTQVVNTGDGYERVADADDGGDGASGEDDLGRAGWVLVAVVFLAFLVVPGIIYVRPTAPGELGFRFLAAMLVLPLLPALLLGVKAVWSLAVGKG